MSGEFGWLGWWGEADIVVRSVFVMLGAFSVVTWWIIIYKLVELLRVAKGERQASLLLSQGAAFDDLQKQLSDGSSTHRLTVEALSPHTNGNLEARLEHLVRDCRMNLESGLTLLATIGNASPFIGLLGTVWGIMHALQGLDSDAAVSLEVVAGPVAEALVATAAGLFAAIPAVVGYNLLLRLLRRVCSTTEGNATRMLAMAKGR